MEFFPLGGCSSKKSGVEESDLLKQVGEYCDEEHMDGGVDCTLSLGLSSSTRSGVGYVESMPVVGLEKGGGGGGHARAVPGGRRCMKCGKTETPLWRNGPNGAKSLCNACGIRFKKEERRASLMLLGMANSSDTKIAEACDDKGAHIALELGTYKDPNGPCHY